MQTSYEPKLKKAKFFGILYFLLLGVINFAATAWYAELGMLDFLILGWGLLPLLFNKKYFLMLFGVFAAVISLYMCLAGLIFSINPAVHTSRTAFMMGYLLALSMLLSSFLLMYAGYRLPGKHKLSPVD